MNTIKSALTSIADELKSLRSQLQETEQQIKIVQIQIAELKKMPVSLEDWSEYLKSAIIQTGEKYFNSINPTLLSGNDAANKQSWDFFEKHPNLSIGILYHLNAFNSAQETDEMMCCFFPDLVHEKIMDSVKKKFNDAWGNTELPSLPERRNLLNEFENNLADLEEKRNGLQKQINEISAVTA